MPLYGGATTELFLVGHATLQVGDDHRGGENRCSDNDKWHDAAQTIGPIARAITFAGGSQQDQPNQGIEDEHEWNEPDQRWRHDSANREGGDTCRRDDGNPFAGTWSLEAVANEVRHEHDQHRDERCEK